MSSIVLELQREALDSKVRITDLLRKSLIVAKKLKQSEFEGWINGELNGYSDAAGIPEYRWIKGEVKVLNPYHGWQPLLFGSAKMAEKLSKMPCGQPISEIEKSASRDLSDGGGFTMNFQPEITAQLMKNMEVPLQPSLHIDGSRLTGILDAVRNTIMNCVHKLEEDGIHGDGLSFSNVEKETASKVVYHVNNFHGPVSNSQIQQGAQHSSQSMSSTSIDTVALKEVAGLLREVIEKAGITGDQKRELEADVVTLEAQAASPKPKISIVKESLSSARKILEGITVKLAVDALPKVTALISHLGQ